MKRSARNFSLYLIILVSILVVVRTTESTVRITPEQKKQLKEKSLEMFYHAYNAYMNHAYPADELMPLSCKGRYRGTEPSRGDIDDALGNFTLTLIDTLDTLAVSIYYSTSVRSNGRIESDQDKNKLTSKSDLGNWVHSKKKADSITRWALTWNPHGEKQQVGPRSSWRKGIGKELSDKGYTWRIRDVPTSSGTGKNESPYPWPMLSRKRQEMIMTPVVAGAYCHNPGGTLPCPSLNLDILIDARNTRTELH